MLRVQGLPDEVTTDQKITAQFLSESDTFYSAKFFPDKFGDCRSALYDTPQPSTPVATPFVIDQASNKYGAQSLCVKAKVPSITNLVYANYQWTYQSTSSLVEASGVPTGINNTRSFQLKVRPSTGSSATHYMYAIANNYDNIPLNEICTKYPSPIKYSDWIPISQIQSITLPSSFSGNYVNGVLCVFGKSGDGTVQLTPRYYPWTGDYEGPAVQLNNSASYLNNLSSFDVSISAVEPLSSCKVKLIPGSTGQCPAVTDGYENCSNQPSLHKVSMNQDGYYSLCAYGFDKIGNPSANAARIYWTRDTTPPTAVLSGTPPTNSINKSAKIYVSGTDMFTFRYATATNVVNCTSWSSLIFAYSSITLETVPGGDGPRVLCVKGYDSLSNEQKTPTTMSWTQDTTALPIAFTSLPGQFSNARTLNAKISAGEDGTYSYAVVPGASCSKSSPAWSSERQLSQNITDTLPAADGQYTLCAMFTDKAGNKLPAPASYTWTKLTAPPSAQAVSGLPMSPNSGRNISLQIGGNNVADYQFALLKSFNSNCTSGVTYSAWAKNTSPLSATIVTPSSNYMTLCLLGRDVAGNVQTTPTIYRWLRLENAPINTMSTVFATIQMGARRPGNLTLTYTRLGSTVSADSATGILCRLNTSNGALGNCINRTASFNTGSASTSITYSNISKGTWVGALLPTQPQRGRVEPLIINY